MVGCWLQHHRDPARGRRARAVGNRAAPGGWRSAHVVEYHSRRDQRPAAATSHVVTAREGPMEAKLPEEIPSLFAEAWNLRDPDALASLFEDDAEFVNVTGL